MKFLSFVALFMLAGIFSQLSAQKSVSDLVSLSFKDNPEAIRSIQQFRQGVPEKAPVDSYAISFPSTYEDMLGKYILLHLMQNEQTLDAITNGYNEFLTQVNVKPSEGEEVLQSVVRVLVK